MSNLFLSIIGHTRLFFSFILACSSCSCLPVFSSNLLNIVYSSEVVVVRRFSIPVQIAILKVFIPSPGLHLVRYVFYHNSHACLTSCIIPRYSFFDRYVQNFFGPLLFELFLFWKYFVFWMWLSPFRNFVLWICLTLVWKQNLEIPI